MTEPARCGVVALVGAPNAGKSTLVNALVGQKLAIVSPKVQTTRTRLLGVALEGSAQLLLHDTPGLFEPKRRMDRAMVADAWEAARDADIILALLDSKTGLSPDAGRMLDRLSQAETHVWLVLNKVDLVAKGRLLELAAEASSRGRAAETFMVSALTGDGVADLKAALARAVPEGPWLYPEDQVTDAPARALAAELTREQLFLQLSQELPYATAVLPESYEERADGSIVIRQQILVDRESQKAIVLGRGGARIRAIGEAARKAIGEALGRPAHLFLHVKVKPDWAEDSRTLADLGFQKTD
ncbi:MAG: GTPase Era [Sphingomonadaceae bacterium]